eukprot:TRINITY_DN82_c0_g1_i1.p1 TRINITY_DN82_c0_g1~~TRINITY_DN82_c0_g1_i1.p1  ORF type:complete len:382 (+),score=78.14 TRINITY_DN82_c0_g1_i1:37-1146(+)
MSFSSVALRGALRATSRVVSRNGGSVAVRSEAGSVAARSAIATGGAATRRSIATTVEQAGSSSQFWTHKKVLGGVVVIAAAHTLMNSLNQHSVEADDSAKWDQIKKEILAVIDDLDYDDGSYGPVLVRLAWHASGTFSQFDQDGGSDGATMRFSPEADHGANAGLAVARALLEPIKQRHPEISYADLWTFAGAVSIEELGGPKIPWRAGRSDKPNGTFCPPDGRLPDAARGADHVRAVFYRMGFSDREIVALLGAHAIGRCHTDRSGFDGPWTFGPTTFSNQYFELMLNQKWTERRWKGPRQFQDPTDAIMMLPADLALTDDADFKKYVELYAKDEKLFFSDFAAAFAKLLELGVPFPEEKKGFFASFF